MVLAKQTPVKGRGIPRTNPTYRWARRNSAFLGWSPSGLRPERTWVGVQGKVQELPELEQCFNKKGEMFYR